LREAVEAAVDKADFVVDLVRETIVHVPLRDRIKERGGRALTIREPPDVLERMFPTEEIKRDVEAVRERLVGCTTLHVTSEAGTDLAYELVTRSPFTQYGYADVPGRWDQWPSALAVVYPTDGTAEGTVVIQSGDIVFPFKRYVETPVRLTVEKGFVVAAEGGLDAQLIEGYLASWRDGDAFAVSHAGFGMHPRAQWSALAFFDKEETVGMDGRCFRGGFVFSTGPNRYTGRFVEAHLDIPLRGCTVEADGELLLDRGRVLEGAPVTAGEA
jgi:2,5-dihydroxypyridine 5,6-dioxygenase